MNKGTILWDLLAVIYAILEFEVKVNRIDWNCVFSRKILLHTSQESLGEEKSCSTRAGIDRLKLMARMQQIKLCWLHTTSLHTCEPEGNWWPVVHPTLKKITPFNDFLRSTDSHTVTDCILELDMAGHHARVRAHLHIWPQWLQRWKRFGQPALWDLPNHQAVTYLQMVSGFRKKAINLQCKHC